MAKHIDERLKAPTAKSFEQWNAQPNRFDLPNVDTPKHSTWQEEKHQETAQFEPKPLTHSQFTQRLNMHKYYGTGR